MPDFSLFIRELRRRNVFRTGAAYLVAAYVGWLLASIAIALLFGLLLGELGALIGGVEPGSAAQW